MKKIYLTIATLFIFAVSFGQIFITEIADPSNDASARFVELYNVGGSSVDLSAGGGYKLQRYTNGNASPQAAVNLTGTIEAGGFYLIAVEFAGFFNAYSFEAHQAIGTGGPADSNGDDHIQLLGTADEVLDLFGIPGADGSNTCHDFEDGRVERISSVVTGNNGSFDEENWNVWHDGNSATGCTNNTDTAQNAPAGFDPDSWIGVAGSCTVSFLSETYTCISNTAGDDNDSVTINVPYTGSDATITSVTTTSGGTVGGDDPASVSSGTITITGLSEGNAWDLTLNGGNCDTNTVSGTVPSAQCDPVALLVINEILADPDGSTGDANGDGSVNTTQDEFVEIYNNGATPVDLENYTLSDAISVRHTFTSTVLGVNTFITVFGGGTPTGIQGIVQTASSGSLGLNNGGDTVTLKNASGITVATYSYLSEGGNNQSLVREPDYTGAFVQGLSHTTNPTAFSPGAENNGILLSVSRNEIEGFAMYPNPVVDGAFTIRSMSNAKMSVEIYDLLGKQVYTNSVLASERIDVSNLTQGVYILRVEDEGKLATRKLIIQ